MTEQSHDGGYDILATKDNTRYLIEVKYSRKNYVPTSSLYNAACRLKVILDMQEAPSVAVLVVGTKRKTDIRTKIENIGNIIILDIENQRGRLRRNGKETDIQTWTQYGLMREF